MRGESLGEEEIMMAPSRQAAGAGGRWTGLTHLSAVAIADLVDGPSAVRVLTEALVSGRVDPEQDSPRLFAPAGPGAEFLMMPSATGGTSGVKVLTLAPGNPKDGRPNVQGVYVLFETEHHAPLAVLDAAELTLVRTPATTVMAAQHLVAAHRGVDPESAVRAQRVVVFGTGPQAERHIAYLNAVLHPDDIAVVGRRPEGVDLLVARSAALGAPVRPADAARDLSRADLIVCATSSRTPLFDVGDVPADAVVCAIGVHGPDKRELPAELVLNADVVVESRAAAMRESGNLLLARPATEWVADAERGRPLANLAELVTGRFTPLPGRPAVFSGVGMAWEDLVVAQHAYDRYRQRA